MVEALENSLCLPGFSIFMLRLIGAIHPPGLYHSGSPELSGLLGAILGLWEPSSPFGHHFSAHWSYILISRFTRVLVTCQGTNSHLTAGTFPLGKTQASPRQL